MEERISFAVVISKDTVELIRKERDLSVKELAEVLMEPNTLYLQDLLEEKEW